MLKTLSKLTIGFATSIRSWISSMLEAETEFSWQPTISLEQLENSGITIAMPQRILKTSPRKNFKRHFKNTTSRKG